jgi:hypothetical protein
LPIKNNHIANGLEFDSKRSQARDAATTKNIQCR